MIFLGVEDVLPIITASNDVIKPALKLKPQSSSHTRPTFYWDGKAKSISNRNFAGLTPICVCVCVVPSKISFANNTFLLLLDLQTLLSKASKRA